MKSSKRPTFQNHLPAFYFDVGLNSYKIGQPVFYPRYMWYVINKMDRKTASKYVTLLWDIHMALGIDPGASASTTAWRFN